MKNKLNAILSFILSLLMLFPFAACGEDSPAKADDITPPAEDTPATDEPTVDQPEEPNIDEPTANDTPTTDEPTADKPSSDEPAEPDEPSDTPTTPEDNPSQPSDIPDEPTQPDVPVEPSDELAKTDPLYSTGWTYTIKRLMFDTLLGYNGTNGGLSICDLITTANELESFSFVDLDSDNCHEILLRFSNNGNKDYYAIEHLYHSIMMPHVSSYLIPNNLVWYDYNIELINSLFVHTLSSDTHIGDLVTIGNFEQDADSSNGTEPIVWRVLANDNGKLFLLSEFGLETRPLNDDLGKPFTWETCSLREYLNNEFYNNNFTDTEKQVIMTATNETPDYVGYSWENPIPFSEGGNDTEDKVFILSIEEAYKYLYTFVAPYGGTCVSTLSARESGKLVHKDNEYGDNPYFCDWWLRSPGADDIRKSYIGVRGDTSTRGNLVSIPYYFYVIRPAMWVDMTK